MADNKTLEARSKNMAAIKGKDTKPEVYLRRLLFGHGYRYRKHSKNIPGHPDLWMKKYNTAIFVNGCFWHRHKDCKYSYTPKSRVEFWRNKFDANVARDEKVKEELYKNNHKCLIIWECTLKGIHKDKDKELHILNEITEFLHSEELYREI